MKEYAVKIKLFWRTAFSDHHKPWMVLCTLALLVFFVAASAAATPKAKKLEKAGKDIIHMEVGEPDFPTPGPIIRAAQQALKNSLTRYTPAAGVPELRQAIASFYQQRYAITVHLNVLLSHQVHQARCSWYWLH